MRNGRFVSFLMVAGFVLLVLWLVNLMSGGHNKDSVFTRSAGSGYASSASVSGTTGEAGTKSSSGSIPPPTASKQLPWDYKVEEGTVGDLLNGDMTILPNNQLLPNDQNYATGDKVWVLSYMSAEMSAGNDNRTDIKLSAWQPIKTYKTKEEADEALADLKAQVKTEVDLVGVYKTEYQGKYREFAVLTLPSGNQIKQPISEERYNALKNEKKAKVVLEEVHDYTNYDSAMAKFRGWAD